MSYRKIKKEFERRFKVKMWIKLFNKDGKVCHRNSKKVTARKMKEAFCENNPFPWHPLSEKVKGNNGIAVGSCQK